MLRHYNIFGIKEIDIFARKEPYMEPEPASDILHKRDTKEIKALLSILGTRHWDKNIFGSIHTKRTNISLNLKRKDLFIYVYFYCLRIGTIPY